MTLDRAIEVVEVVLSCALILLIIAIMATHKWERWKARILANDVRSATKAQERTGQSICLICTHVRLHWHVDWPPFARLMCTHRADDNGVNPLTGKKRTQIDAAARNPDGQCPNFIKDDNTLRAYGLKGRLP